MASYLWEPQPYPSDNGNGNVPDQYKQDNYYHRSKNLIISALIQLYSNSFFPRTVFWWNGLGCVGFSLCLG